MKKFLTILLAMTALCLAQTSTTPNFSTAPTVGLVGIESRETLTNAATRACSNSSLTVTRTSGTVLTINTSSANQFVRFGTKTRTQTSAITATLSGTPATGSVQFYAQLNASGSLVFFAYNNSTNTLALSSGTVIQAPAALPVAPLVLFYTWNISTTAGNWDAAGTDTQPNEDCWVDLIELVNKTAGAVTVTITDNQGTPLNEYTAVSLAANTTTVLSLPGGTFFEGGMLIQASATASIDAHYRAKRVRHVIADFVGTNL